MASALVGSPMCHGSGYVIRLSSAEVIAAQVV
jgi:hypothetical protein